MACSSDSIINDVEEPQGQVPMQFSQAAVEAPSITRALTRGTTLKQGFMVSAWKKYGAKDMQVVMNDYKVEYDTETKKWNYVGVNNQPQRYWDLSAFPYEFQAVTPYLSTAAINENGVVVDVAEHPFQAQTYVEDQYNVSAKESEQFLVANVSRQKIDKRYEDTDYIKNSHINIEGEASATRMVALPFHHVISKVGFRLFIDNPKPQSTDYRVVLKSISISVVNANNEFITSSKKYQTTKSQGLGKGTFAENTTATDEYTLLLHSEYAGEDLLQHVSSSSALDLCPDYLQQIPQKDVQIRVQVSMQIEHLVGGSVDETETYTYDSVLDIDKTNATGELFTWEPDTKYTYYLHIPTLLGHEVWLDSCEVSPWDEVQSSEIIVEL